METTPSARRWEIADSPETPADPGQPPGDSHPAIEARFGVSVAIALVLAAAVAIVPVPLAAQSGAARAGTLASDTAAPGADVAIYPGGPALVREALQLPLVRGESRVTWSSPPAGLDFSSLSLAFPGASGAEVVRQRHLPGHGGLGGLLHASVGREVGLALADGDTLRGTLLSDSVGLLVRTSGGGIAALSPGQVRAVLLPALPKAFRRSPAIAWTVRSTHSGAAMGRLRYLTGGVTWNAEYALTLARSGKRLDLEAWADLRDEAGRSWPGARVRLIAGEIHRARGGHTGVGLVQLESRAVAVGQPPLPEERAFSEYHVFELPSPVSLEPGQTVRALLLRAAGVPTRKLYLFHGGETGPYGSSRPLTRSELPGIGSSPTNVTAALELTTGKGTPISAPLPAGRARIYERDADGTELLAGETDVPNLMVGDTVRLPLGLAFDLTAERTRTDFRRPGQDTLEESWRIVFRSAKKEPVDVQVTERMFRWHEWRILRETVDGKSISHRKPDAEHAAWTVTVPAGGSVTLDYTVRYSWKEADLR